MIGKPFIILSSVDSTNNHAMQLIREGKAGNGMAIFALEQVRGKGQRGRNWHSEAGKNIMLTIVMEGTPFKPTEQFPFSAAVSLACYDFFSKYAGEETCIKWPNDLFWRDRKAGGILIENIIREDKWQWIVVGIGININQVDFKEIDSRAVSLKQICGKTFDTITLSQELFLHMNNRIEALLSKGTDKTIEAYNRLLFKRGEQVKFRKNQILFKAKVLQSNMNGELEIEHGIIENVRHGEVEWVL